METLVKKALKEALDQLLRADAELLNNDVNERSISHRLACYLEPLFPGWNVDCEYNRKHDDPGDQNLHGNGAIISLWCF